MSKLGQQVHPKVTGSLSRYLEVPISAKGRHRKEKNIVGKGREGQREPDASVNVSKLFHIGGYAIVICIRNLQKSRGHLPPNIPLS